MSLFLLFLNFQLLVVSLSLLLLFFNFQLLVVPLSLLSEKAATDPHGIPKSINQSVPRLTPALAQKNHRTTNHRNALPIISNPVIISRNRAARVRP